MFIEIVDVLPSFCEGIVELDLAGRRLLLRRSRFVVRDELIVNKFKGAHFADLAIDSSTVRTLLRFPTLVVDFLADCHALHVVDVGPSQFSEVGPALLLD